MLVVSIDLWRRGNKADCVHLGSVKIANISPHATSRADYRAVLYGKRRGVVQKRARVLNFPRKRLTAFDLLYRVLRAAVGGRNP